MKFWTLITGTVSQALLTVNSSINFLMYPAISKDFQSVFKQYIAHKIRFIFGLLEYWKCRTRRSLSQGSTPSLQESCHATVRIHLPSSPMIEDVEDPTIHLAEMPNQAITPSDTDGDVSQDIPTYSSFVEESNKSGGGELKTHSVRLLHSISLDDQLQAKKVESALLENGICIKNQNHIDEAISKVIRSRLDKM